ncbi:MAG: glycosyltransferase family 4 protein [Myxococcota bacterium]
MLKLCLAHPVFHPIFGGGGLRFRRYLPGLQKRDVQVRVLSGTNRAKDLVLSQDGPDWSRYRIGEWLPTERLDGIPLHRVRLPKETGVRRTSIWFRRLIELCRTPETRPDVIQLHSFERLESLFWLPRLRRLGLPLVYAVQITSPRLGASAPIRAAHHAMLRRFYGSFDAIVTSSEQIGGHLRRLGVERPIAIIPNGVDLDRYRPRDGNARRAARARLGIRGDGPVLLSVGSVSARKGSDILIDAWSRCLAQCPSLELVLIGPCPDPTDQRHRAGAFGARIAELVRAARRPDQVHFTGVRDDVEALYAAADLFVLPTSREGGTPNGMLEAMACGLPVVITPFEGQSTAIGRPGLEFVQAARTADSLHRTLADLLDDAPRCQALARRGRAWVERHLALDRSLDRFTDLYGRLASGDLDAGELDARNPRFPTAWR